MSLKFERLKVLLTTIKNPGEVGAGFRRKHNESILKNLCWFKVSCSHNPKCVLPQITVKAVPQVKELNSFLFS